MHTDLQINMLKITQDRVPKGILYKQARQIASDYISPNPFHSQSSQSHKNHKLFILLWNSTQIAQQQI